jgi:hypothetical protein
VITIENERVLKRLRCQWQPGAFDHRADVTTVWVWADECRAYRDMIDLCWEHLYEFVTASEVKQAEVLAAYLDWREHHHLTVKLGWLTTTHHQERYIARLQSASAPEQIPDELEDPPALVAVG